MPSVDPPATETTSVSRYPRPFGPRYMLLRHLATGGMADVFLARQTGPGGFVKECVIKRILPAMARDRQFVEMFLDEARLVARLNHPNIAGVYDHGQVGDDYFIAMEHVDGADLEQVIEKLADRGEAHLPYAIAARIVAGVAEGLEHAHNAVDGRGRPLGLVHRDVTPSNVVISFDGVPKLLDFGIAKVTNKNVKTELGVIKGKLPYMSPEQVEGEPLDGRSDVFSLGAILYELTTGKKPFDGENAAQLGLRILHDEPSPPSLLEGDYPDTLEAILLRALAKRTADRTPSARVLRMELERFLVESGASVTSYDVAAYLAERFPRKRFISSGTPALGVPINPGASESMNEEERRRPRVTGQLTIGDPSTLGDLPPSEHTRSRRSLGGGGRWTVAIIVGLMATTGLVLYALRSYEIKKENAIAPLGAPSAAAAEVPAPAPSSVVEKRAAPVAEKAPAPSVAAAPAADPVAEPKAQKTPEVKAAPEPAADATPDQPKITPLPAGRPEARKPAARQVRHVPVRHEPPPAAAALPKSLPRLPTPPPSDPE